MQVQRRITAGEALTAFVRLARSTRLTGDEHEQFALYAQVLGGELDEGEKAKQELEQLKAEHAKCAQQPSGANPDSGQVGGQGDGAHMGKDRGALELIKPIQEPLLGSDKRGPGQLS